MSRAPLPTLRQHRVRPRDPDSRPFPSTSDAIRVAARALVRGDLKRAALYQLVIDRHIEDARR